MRGKQKNENRYKTGISAMHLPKEERSGRKTDSQIPDYRIIIIYHKKLRTWRKSKLLQITEVRQHSPQNQGQKKITECNRDHHHRLT